MYLSLPPSSRRIDQRRRDSNADGKGQARPAGCQAKHEPLPGLTIAVRGQGPLPTRVSEHAAQWGAGWAGARDPSQWLLLLACASRAALEGGMAVVAADHVALAAPSQAVSL
jgi:hypothetical protein